MPELPEVETVRRGLAPYLEGATITDVDLARPDLRFPFPKRFVERLKGARVVNTGRRGKYMTADLSTEETLILHLGMSGRFMIEPLSGAGDTPSGIGDFHFSAGAKDAHNHVTLQVDGPAGAARLIYNDTRRFGFMDLAPTDGLQTCRHFSNMGPEPLSDALTPQTLAAALAGKSGPIKTALLDQRVAAGLGNIYVCEALFRARISPNRQAGNVQGVKAERLCAAIKDVLREAIEAGGSTLRDFAHADGALGYFQHRFSVYDRQGEACKVCGDEIKRIIQQGRSTYYCSRCQR